MKILFILILVGLLAWAVCLLLEKPYIKTKIKLEARKVQLEKEILELEQQFAELAENYLTQRPKNHKSTDAMLTKNYYITLALAQKRKQLAAIEEELIRL
jgi:hypothetical protein